MNKARAKILARLRHNRPLQTAAPNREAVRHGWSIEERIARFSQAQQAVRGEVHLLARTQWLDWLAQQLPARQLQQVLLPGDHAQSLPGLAALPGIKVRSYSRAIEDWKDELFDQVDVAITRCRGAIAETGSLVLWPDAHAPRLMSLVPPVHIALLDAQSLHESFAAMIEDEHWAAGLPSNALLISGPSKTADIEQTLAYGIHGPRQLITLILN